MSVVSVAWKHHYKILFEAFAQVRSKRLLLEAGPEGAGRIVTLSGSIRPEEGGGEGGPVAMGYTEQLVPIHGWWRVTESLRRTASSAVPDQALEQVVPTRVEYDPPLPRWPLRVEAGQEVAAAGEVISYGDQGLLRREAYEVAAKVLAPQQVAGYRVYPVKIRQTVAGERLEKISWLDEAGLELAIYTRKDQPPMTSWQWILDGPRPLTLADLQELLRALS